MIWQKLRNRSSSHSAGGPVFLIRTMTWSLETAVSGSADAIVTFNLRHFEPAARLFDCPVLLPKAALQELRSFGYET